MAASSEVVELPGEFYKNMLSDVMKREFKDFTTIVTAASGKGENFNGLLYRITGEGVKKDDDTNTSQLSLVLKIPIQIPSLREKWPVNMIYRKEVYIYNVILPELYLLQDSFAMPESERFRAAKCYSAGDEEFEEYLLMEDLCVSGYKLSNRRVSLSYRQMQLILKTLASFHALSFVLKKLKPEKFIEFSTYLNDLQAFPPELMGFVIVAQSRALSVLDDPVLLEKATNYGSPDIVQKLMELMDPKNVNPYSVICHGDCWNNNLLFKSEEDEPVDIMLLDWQISRNCSPITDIAYLIFSSTDYDLRKEHFKDLMDHYHSCLAKSLSYMDCDVEDHFPKAVFEDHLKKILPYGLFMSFMLLPAVLGEAEDVPDMDELLKKEKLDVNDLKFENKQSSNRYNIRMNGVVRTLVELDLI